MSFNDMDFTGLNYWSLATLGGSVGPKKRGKGNRLLPSEVAISKCDRANAWYFFNNCTVVSDAVNQFITEVTRGGFHVIVSAGGKKYEFEKNNKEYARYYNKVLAPGVRHIIFEWIMFGYARVRILNINKKDGYPFPMFVVMEEGLTDEYIEWDNDRRSYGLYYADEMMNGKRGKKVPGGTILVMDAPLANGQLNSRVSHTFGPLRQIKQAMHNYTDASFYNAHPPYVITPEFDRNRRNAEEEVRMVEAAESAIAGTTEARQHVRQQVLREEAEEDRMRSIHSNPGSANSSSLVTAMNNSSVIPRGNPSLYLGGVDTGSLDTLASVANVMMEEPWQHGITLPRGHKMNSVPAARAPDQFLLFLERLEHQVARSIGIPPGMLEGGANQRHAASVEMSNRELATNVIMFHQYAEILLQDFFQELFADTIQDAVMKRVMSENRELDEGYWAEQRDAVEVEVKFHYNPIMTLESLIVLHEQGIIHSEAKRDIGLRLYGMSEDAGEKDPDKALAKRQQQMVTAESKGKAVLEEVKAKVASQKRPASSTTSSSSDSNKKQK